MSKSSSKIMDNTYPCCFLPASMLLISLLAIFVFSLWYERERSKIADYRNHSVANDVANYFSSVFVNESFILEFMAEDWEGVRDDNISQYLEDKVRWKESAEKIIYHYGFQALEWVEGTHVRWVFPYKGNEKAMGVDLSLDKSIREAMEIAAKKDQVTIGGPVDLVQGGKGLLLFAPIIKVDLIRGNWRRKCEGFIVGVIRADEYFEKNLSRFGQCSVSILSGDELIYSSNNDLDGASTYVDVNGFNFEIRAKCGIDIEESNNWWYLMALLVGIITKMIVAFRCFRARMQNIDSSIDKNVHARHKINNGQGI